MGLFGRSKSNSKPAKGKHRRDVSLISQKDGILERKVMEGAERELYQYDQPQQELGMSDLIKNHESGTRFMYAALTGRESEEVDSKLRRLISFKPKLNKKSITVDDLPTIRLYRETETFPLSQVILRDKKSGNQGTYVRISDAMVMYGAVVSPDCFFTHVTVGISDSRLLKDNLVKSFRATTNIPNKGNLALPYYVPRDEIDCLTLTVSRERAFLEEGRQWGAIQIQLLIEFSDFPMQFSNQPVAAINMMPSTALEEPVNNPNNIDISILNQDKKKLAELFLEGDVADEDEPIVNKTAAVKYAKSSISGAKKGKVIQNQPAGWEFMQGQRIGMADADQNSIEPDEEGSIDQQISERNSPNGSVIFSDNTAVEPGTIKSAMKKNVMFRTPTPPPTNRKISDTERLTPW